MAFAQIIESVVEIEAVDLDRNTPCSHAFTKPRNEKAALASDLSDGANPTD